MYESWQESKILLQLSEVSEKVCQLTDMMEWLLSILNLAVTHGYDGVVAEAQKCQVLTSSGSFDANR